MPKQSSHIWLYTIGHRINKLLYFWACMNMVLRHLGALIHITRTKLWSCQYRSLFESKCWLCTAFYRLHFGQKQVSSSTDINHFQFPTWVIPGSSLEPVSPLIGRLPSTITPPLPICGRKFAFLSFLHRPRSRTNFYLGLHQPCPSQCLQKLFLFPSKISLILTRRLKFNLTSFHFTIIFITGPIHEFFS